MTNKPVGLMPFLKKPLENMTSECAPGNPLMTLAVRSPRVDALKRPRIFYDRVQMGTWFIDTDECVASINYKNAILRATVSDIALLDKISGVPVSNINPPMYNEPALRPEGFSVASSKNP